MVLSGNVTLKLTQQLCEIFLSVVGHTISYQLTIMIPRRLSVKILEVYGKVIKDGFEFYGQVEEEQFCSTCKFNLVYYDDFDAYFCPQCNSWSESKCSNTNCKYCSSRPEKPLVQKKPGV